MRRRTQVANHVPMSALAIYRSSRKMIGNIKRVYEHYGGGRARDCWFSSIRCDNDFANVSSRFKEIVGGSHRFGSKPREQGRYNWPDTSFSDEGSNSFESASLALNVVPVENLAEDHFRMQRCGLQHKSARVE